MQINIAQPASRQQLQDEVLALIRSRASAAQPAGQLSRQPAAQEKAAPAEPAQTEQAVHAINGALKLLSTSLRFEVDEESGKTLVKVMDRDSGELLRQIPSEATLQIARSLDKMVGHLVNQAI